MRTGSKRPFRFGNFREALAFVQKVGELAEAEGHHPDISFGWGYGTVSLRTKKIKGLHENDFIMAAKIDRLASAWQTKLLDKLWGEFIPQWLPILSWGSIILGLATAAVIAIDIPPPRRAGAGRPTPASVNVAKGRIAPL